MIQHGNLLCTGSLFARNIQIKMNKDLTATNAETNFIKAGIINATNLVAKSISTNLLIPNNKNNVIKVFQLLFNFKD